MRTRRTNGTYTPHLSPGDGVGFSKVPEQDAQTHQASCDHASGDVTTIDYSPARTAPVAR